MKTPLQTKRFGARHLWAWSRVSMRLHSVAWRDNGRARVSLIAACAERDRSHHYEIAYHDRKLRA